MSEHWWLHAVLWFEAAGMVWCAVSAEREWKSGRWQKLRPWYIRFCVAAAFWFVYCAGMFVP